LWEKNPLIDADALPNPGVLYGSMRGAADTAKPQKREHVWREGLEDQLGLSSQNREK
jgi:hypothetical protein